MDMCKYKTFLMPLHEVTVVNSLVCVDSSTLCTCYQLFCSIALLFCSSPVIFHPWLVNLWEARGCLVESGAGE